MWTPEDRVLVGDFGAGQASSDEQHGPVEPLIPPAKPGGRPADHRPAAGGCSTGCSTSCARAVSGAICRRRRRAPSAAAAGGRHLPPPPAFPPSWQTVCGYFRAFLKAGVWERLRHHLVAMLREREGRGAGPTAAILDTQSVETTEQGGPRGYDAATRVKGRKRHIAVDTRGLPLGVAVHAADIQDADGAGDPLRRLKRLYGWLRAVFADGIYDRLAVPLVCRLLGLALIIVRPIAGVTGFVVLPRRWVVERTLGWLGRWRRLSKDYYEEPPEVSEAMIALAMIRLMLHRLAHPNRRHLPAP